MKEYVALRNKLRRKFGFWKNPYRNPLYYWRKMKEIFKKPPLHLHIGKYRHMMLCDYMNPPKIQFICNGLGWKDKWNSPRFEYPPNILFKLFNFEIRLIWSWGDDFKDSVYWETLLDLCVYNKTLEDAITYNTWTGDKNVKTLKMLK